MNKTVEENILASFLRMAEQMGTGWMPTFPEITGDSRRMNSNHAIPSFADAIAKGLKVDIQAAYEAGRKGLTEKTLAPWCGNPAGWLDEFYWENGFVPALREGEEETDPNVHRFEKRQPVAVSLGTAYDSWALSKLAEAAGKKEDAEYYRNWSSNYKKLFNPETLFFHPRDKEGNFYGTFNSKGQYPKDADGGWASFGIEVGDKVTVEGPKSVYQGTVELVDASIIKIEKSLIDASLTTATVSPAAGKDTLLVSSKVQPVLVSVDADWIKVSDLTSDGNYLLVYEENVRTADRTATITIKAPGAVKALTIKQEGVPATGMTVTEIIAAADDDMVQTLPSTVVVALTTRGAVVSDGQNALYVYGNSAAALKVGDGVRILGTIILPATPGSILQHQGMSQECRSICFPSMV